MGLQAPISYWKDFREVLKEELEALRTILEVGLDTGTATGGASTTLTDEAKDWGTDQWKDAYVEITEGTGEGQIRKIVGNTSNTLTVSVAWTTVPDTTSKYRIFGAPSEVTLLDSILAQLDITLSALRDALKGAGNKDFTTLESDIESINAKIQSQSADVFVKDLSVGTDPAQVDTDSAYRDEVIILADSGNTDTVYVGNSSNQLFPLAGGASVAIRKTALSLIYVRAASGTQSVHILSGGS